MRTRVDHRLACLRDNLLGGRGPGASADEVACHTRDRAFIGGVPAPRELELVEVQTQLARRIPSAANGIRRDSREPIFWLVLGAGSALLLRALLHRAAGYWPTLHHDDGPELHN